MIPLQLTLKIYHSNRVRLDMVKLPIPTNLTRWINEAISKRLDVEHPETIGAVEVLSPEPEKPVNPMELWEKAKQAPKPLDFIGSYRIKYGQDPAFLALAEGQRRDLKKKGIVLGLEDLLEIVAKKNDMELSEDEKVSIMAEHRQKQLEVAAVGTTLVEGEIPEDVRGHPNKYNKWRVEEDARLKAAETDFWGEAV